MAHAVMCSGISARGALIAALHNPGGPRLASTQGESLDGRLRFVQMDLTPKASQGTLLVLWAPDPP
jgi:hypothetical protein